MPTPVELQGSQLPAAAALTGTETLIGIQGEVTSLITTDQVQDYIKSKLAPKIAMSAPGTITAAGATVSVTFTLSGFYQMYSTSVAVETKLTSGSTWVERASVSFNDELVTTIAFTGLAADTQYDVRLVLTDSLNPDLNVVTASQTFTTLAA